MNENSEKPDEPMSGEKSGSYDGPSQSQLLSNTWEDDTQYSLMRSPEGPMGGRSVKEYEEHVSALKKENFDLKLRMYFLEEKLGPNFSLEKEEILRKNLDLEMEMENLRKDVQEKHNLLCEAVKAMELSDEEYKRSLTEKSNEIDNLKDRITTLEEELEEERSSNNSIDNIRDRCNRLYYDYEQLEVDVQRKDEIIKDLQEELHVSNEKVESLNMRINELEQEMDDVTKEKQKLTVNLSEKTVLLTDTESQLQDMKKRFSCIKVDYEKDRQRLEKQKLVAEMKSQELEDDLNKQKQRVHDLQKKLAQVHQELKSNQNLLVSDSDKVAALTAAQPTDLPSVAVQDTAAPVRISEKDALRDALADDASPLCVNNASSKSSLPSLDSDFDFAHFEKLLQEIPSITVKMSLQEQYNEFRDTLGKLEKKISVLKASNLKFCTLLQGFVKYKNETIQKEKVLADRIKHLEQNVQNVVKETSSSISSGVDNSSKSCDEGEESDNLDHIISRVQERIQDLHLFSQKRNVHIKYLESQNQLMLSRVQSKDSELIDLERRLSRTSEQTNLTVENNESIYIRLLDEKKQEIKQLNEELIRKNSDLQAIVNKELWNKNKEIEKMQIKHRQEMEEKEIELDKLRADYANLNTDYEVMRDEQEDKDMELSRLKIDLSDVNLQLQLLKEKICDVGVQIDEKGEIESYLASLHDIKNLQSLVKNVTKENETLKKKLSLIEESLEKTRESNLDDLYEKKLSNLEKQYELSEQLRHQTNDACSILRAQLEELALFLDSLMKQKSVLGFLGTSQNKKLRDVIDQSLDLSRSLTVSFSLQPDQSLLQLTNITELLNNSDTLNISNLQDSTNDQGAIINMLEEQIQNLKWELEIRDSELNKIKNKVKTSPKDLKLLYQVKAKTPTKRSLEFKENNSESETWSEPDLNVSKERIGLNDSSHDVIQCSDSTDDGTECALPDSKNKGGILGNCQNAINNLTKQVKELQLSLFEKEDSYIKIKRNLESQVSLLLKENEEYRSRLGTLQPEFEKIKSTLDIAENDKQKAENELCQVNSDLKQFASDHQTLLLQNEIYNERIKTLELELEKIETEKQQLKKKNELLEISNEEYETKEKELFSKIAQLEFEREQLVNLTTEYAGMTENSRKELAELEMQMKNLNGEKEKLEIDLKREYEAMLLAKLEIAEEEFLKNLKHAELEAKNHVNLLNQELDKLKNEYRGNYVKKCEVDEKINEVENLKQELKQLQEEFSACKKSVQSSGNEEKRLKEEINRLCLKLDEATLQYSNAVLEKTTLNNERAALEKELNKMNDKKRELEKQFEEIHAELAVFRDTYQKEIAVLQSCKSKLEVKVSELEYANADLHNRLAKLSESGEPGSARSSSQAFDFRPYDRQTSNTSQTYTSEDEVKARSVFSLISPKCDSDREANASPDLGIESDQGRFSSLEAVNSNVSRPLLQTLEITESMNHLLDGDRARSVGSCENKFCYQKSFELTQENMNLKKKLIKTRKALEDTFTQLTLANQRKKQVERNICKQIHKTSQVLREAKANLDSGSETDMCKK